MYDKGRVESIGKEVSRFAGTHVAKVRSISVPGRVRSSPYNAETIICDVSASHLYRVAIQEKRFNTKVKLSIRGGTLMNNDNLLIILLLVVLMNQQKSSSD